MAFAHVGRLQTSSSIGLGTVDPKAQIAFRMGVNCALPRRLICSSGAPGLPSVYWGRENAPAVLAAPVLLSCSRIVATTVGGLMSSRRVFWCGLALLFSSVQAGAAERPFEVLADQPQSPAYRAAAEVLIDPPAYAAAPDTGGPASQILGNRQRTSPNNDLTLLTRGIHAFRAGRKLVS